MALRAVESVPYRRTAFGLAILESNPVSAFS